MVVPGRNRMLPRVATATLVLIASVSDAFCPHSADNIRHVETGWDVRIPLGAYSSFGRAGCSASWRSTPWRWLASDRLHGTVNAQESAHDAKQSRPQNDKGEDKSSNGRPKIVLVTGFESFNRDLYSKAADELDMDLQVFADTDIVVRRGLKDALQAANPVIVEALQQADAVVASLIFDFDDVAVLKQLVPNIAGPRLIFESDTDLMSFNQVGTFNMMKNDDGPSGPPPVVKAILSKFGSGKEEDKLAGYLKLLKVGPDLLKWVPGEKAGDLRAWLEAYRYWNQGGARNVQSMLTLLAQLVIKSSSSSSRASDVSTQQIMADLPDLQVTPDVGVIHPLQVASDLPFFTSPAGYLEWRLSSATTQLAQNRKFVLADAKRAPRVAILLFRKHVITEQHYIQDLIRIMEGQGILPVPIFINGVEAHTIVRDLLTSGPETRKVRDRTISRPTSYQSAKAVQVDAIVNTVGFPLVGGPAGSMEAGRNVAVAEQLLTDMNVPYIVASPLLLQSIPQWRQNGVLGLQSVVLYSLPELDGAVDTVVLGGLVGDKIALVPERVRKLTSRVKAWVDLRRTRPADRRIAVSLYGFPPNVGAVGTAALLDVPRSLDALLDRLHAEGYDVGNWASDPEACGESIVAALSVLCESPVIAAGAGRMKDAIEAKAARAQQGDETVASTLAKNGAGLGGARVVAKDMTANELEELLGKYMFRKVRRSWTENDRGPGVTAKNEYNVAGLQIGNVWVFVQPLLGVEGDPMRLLFERDLTPHPQYCATYKWLQSEPKDGGFGAHAIIHLGMHGTVEWLPGQNLGNDRQSWSDELLGNLPNIYVYATNNPSESILAKRRGYGTIVSYNVPPYGRSGLYLELSMLKELVDEYRTSADKGSNRDLWQTIYDTVQRTGMLNDVPFVLDGSPFDVPELPVDLAPEAFAAWVSELSDYLTVLSERLFSSGLHVLGARPSEKELDSYIEAYFGDKLEPEERVEIVQQTRHALSSSEPSGMLGAVARVLQGMFDLDPDGHGDGVIGGWESPVHNEASSIVSLLDKSTEELDAVLKGLDGGYIAPVAGGDLLRDGPSVLPTGRNIHSLDPYRMPSAGAWSRGQRAAKEIIRQHRESNGGKYPETVAVTLWGLDAIKTRGESVAIALSLVGAQPVREGTGRIVRFDLIPLEELDRPRIDVLASMSGIFRDSFANVVDLLDDMFERAALANEPIEMNFIKKHADELIASGVSERAAARLFSNPPGDYGSMVNEVVGTGDWEDDASLGETWKGRNVFSYGRNEGSAEAGGTARPEVLDKLLATTDRIVQEIDSVEYGLSDIQEYYANTGALKKAAENRKATDETTGKKKPVSLSVIEAFGNTADDAPVTVKDVEEVLRLEYRSKMLNPKWRDAMLAQGSGGAYEISQRMTAMVGWAATASVDNFVFDQAAERYALDEEVAKQLQKANPEAFKNVVRRLLEAAGRGMWSTDDDTLSKLQELYADADDIIEQGSTTVTTSMVTK